MKRKLEEIRRRLLTMVSISRVKGSNDTGKVQTLQTQTPLDVRPDTARFSEFGFSSGLPEGTDVVVLSFGGDRSSQVIVASNHNGLRFQNLKAGETVIYNQWGQSIKLTEKLIEVEANSEDVIVKNAKTVMVEATEKVLIDSPDVEMTGNLKVAGEITDRSGANASTVGDLRDRYNAHKHDVPNVESGGSTATSNTTESQV